MHRNACANTHTRPAVAICKSYTRVRRRAKNINFTHLPRVRRLHVFIRGVFMIHAFLYVQNCVFSVLYFSNRTVALEHVLYLTARQQHSGQACDPWPLTVKLTLPPVGCCAKCQERPLILSCCLVGHSAPNYLSCPDQCSCILRSARLRCGLYCLPEREPPFLTPAECLICPTEIFVF